MRELYYTGKTLRCNCAGVKTQNKEPVMKTETSQNLKHKCFLVNSVKNKLCGSWTRILSSQGIKILFSLQPSCKHSVRKILGKCLTKRKIDFRKFYIFHIFRFFRRFSGHFPFSIKYSKKRWRIKKIKKDDILSSLELGILRIQDYVLNH